MRIAYLECFSGMSGDMFLGALIDAGVSPRVLEDTVAALNVGARLEISRVVRSGISAAKVDVLVGEGSNAPHAESGAMPAADAVVGKVEHKREHPHSHHDHHHHGQEHEQDHSHGEAHQHSYSHSHPNSDVHSHGRGLMEIREIINRAAIGVAAKKTAIAMFEALGAAEARIHATPIESIHFHEVGAVDAMVDIICAAVGAEALGVDEFVCSPLNVGGGTVKCAHGDFPVPAPATLELLKDAPVYSSGLNAELVTPTGAAIVKTLAGRFAAFPTMKIERSGYGAGSKDFSGHPNVVRLTVGEAAAVSEVERGITGSRTSDTVAVLEANLDDLNPQVFGYVLERLLEEGALDVFGVPVQMKKNRPGTVLTVLCKPEDADKLTQLIFSETTTLGVRRRDEARATLARRWEKVRTEWGEVRIKIASMNGTVTNYAPEYEDCRSIAAEHHVPLKTVMQEAARIYLGGERLSPQGTRGITG